MPARNIDRKTRKLFRTGWLIALLLVAWAIFSPWGAIRYYRLSNNLKQLKTTNLELQEDNRELREEINLLSSDPAYIEKVAREKHNLLKSNEFVYVFPNKKKGKH